MNRTNNCSPISEDPWFVFLFPFYHKFTQTNARSCPKGDDSSPENKTLSGSFIYSFLPFVFWWERQLFTTG